MQELIENKKEIKELLNDLDSKIEEINKKNIEQNLLIIQRSNNIEKNGVLIMYANLDKQTKEDLIILKNLALCEYNEIESLILNIRLKITEEIISRTSKEVFTKTNLILNNSEMKGQNKWK